MDTTSDTSPIQVLQLGSLNERKLFNNQSISEFDVLRNAIPVKAGAMTRMNGIEYLTQIAGQPIVGFCQTNDSRGSILVQTTTALYQFTTEEFFQQAPYIPVLSYAAILEEETMPQAIIAHQVASGTVGGTMANNTSYQQAPLNVIVSQLNADGTAAAFATLAANQITLQAGTYRIRGWSKGTVVALATRLRSRLYNITTAGAAWAGLPNEASDEGQGQVAGKNFKMEFGGMITIGGSTVFEIQNKASSATATSTFGVPSTDTEKEIYRWIDILKTA